MHHRLNDRTKPWVPRFWTQVAPEKKHPPIGLSGEWCSSLMTHSWVLLLNWDNEARVPPLLATTSYYQFSLFAACIVKSSKTKISKISLTCPRNQLYTFSKRTRASMDYVWGLCFWNRHTGPSQWCFTWWLKIIVGISACINSDVNLVKRPSTDGLKPHCWGWMHASSANLHSLAGTKHTALTFFANTHFGKQTTETQWNGIQVYIGTTSDEYKQTGRPRRSAKLKTFTEWVNEWMAVAIETIHCIAIETM